MKLILAASTAMAIVASFTAGLAAPELQPGSEIVAPAVSNLQRRANVDVSPIHPGDEYKCSICAAGVNGLPSYLLRKDGMLINGLLPTSPDAQG